MDNWKKKLPIGIEDFKEIVKEDFYYVDKTGLMRELIQNWGKVNLFTRPRRFGKSLNMSMLRRFFEIGGDQRIFDGLEISKEKELCEEYMGQYPVVAVSLKNVYGENFGSAYRTLCSDISWEALRFSFLEKSEKLSAEEKETYKKLAGIQNAKESEEKRKLLEGSLKALSMLLEKHYGKQVILLIDEYDVPLAKAFQYGFYDEMVMFIRKFLEQALKTNDSLKFAVLTGCLRIAKESIFTGLNNFKVFSVADVGFNEYFGFTDREVKELLEYYDLSDKFETMKEWYDGYQFGNLEVYCPWDVINYCYDLRWDREKQPQNYWINTSSNDAVRKFIEKADKGTLKREVEQLIAGEVITKEIHQELTYQEMYDSIENIWSLLFTTGYLTQRGKPDGNFFPLAIPNVEIRNIFASQIMALFKENVRKNGETLNRFCDALKNGETEKVQELFGDYLRKTISIRDTFVRRKMKENFYHGILIGILGVKEEWDVSSNRETGDGYADIFIETEDEIGIIIELKYAAEGRLEAACREALEQIQNTQYEENLREDGIETIRKYGIACYKKRCRVMQENA